MNKMKDVIFRLPVVVAATLFIATAMLWVQSYRENIWFVSCDADATDGTYESHGFGAGHGGLCGYFDLARPHFFAGHRDTDRTWHLWGSPPAAQPYPSFPDPQLDMAYYDKATIHGFRWMGFEAKHIIVMSGEDPILRETGFVIPIPALAAITALLPLRMILRLRQRRSQMRIAKGQCGACGYDLRATRDRCPECGSMNAQGARTLGLSRA